MPAQQHAASWSPTLGSLRLLGDGRSVAVLGRDATVLWWCAPDMDSPPLCWQLLDEGGGRASFDELQFYDADEAPAGATATTVLRGTHGLVEVRDALLPQDDGVLLVRLLRRKTSSDGGVVTVRHRLRLAGFDAPAVVFDVDGRTASGRDGSGGDGAAVSVVAHRHRREGADLVSELDLTGDGWEALLVGVGAPDGALATLDAPTLADRAAQRDRQERERLEGSLLPESHPERALDALAVIRACTYQPTGAVVAAPTTSLPEAPGHDRQFDYRYTWLRDASLSTAVAALLGQAEDARRYLDFVHRAWGDEDLLTRPLVTVRGGQVPEERDVDGVAGWAASRPVRVGNGARDQRQYDALGLFVEAVSVYVQVGGQLDDRTWSLVQRLADQVAADDPQEAKDSNGIWEVRQPEPLVDGDLGRWLVLDRALWIARGWRPWTRRRHWKTAREQIARRVHAAVHPSGLLPQAYGQDPPLPDASALMAVAFGLLDDQRAHALVDALLERLGAGPYLYRYPPGGDDGFTGIEGAFLPVSFLAVTALGQLGRTDEASKRLDRLCASLPRLLSEEVDPQTGRLLGNTPLVWSHAELARAVYVLDAARRQEKWSRWGLWAWRLQRYLRLRHDQARGG